ncbi:MAG: hypothetical protein IJ597_05295, partial [Synergistaceae bacterium]|nr:hypothetical protein [Synergistaceae bacterium]
YIKGFFIMTMMATSTNVTNMNNEADYLANELEAVSKDYRNGLVEQHYEDLRYNPAILENNAAWFDKIQDLCRQNSAELVLIKIPTIHFPQYYAGAWTRQRSELAKNFAREHQLKFYDLLYDYDVGIDSATDFYDGGYHLNTLGAEKVTNVLEKIILENLPNAERKVVKQYDDSLEPYHKMINTVKLQTRTNLVEYLNFLRENLDKYLVAISVCDDARNSLTEDEMKALTALGLHCDFANDFHFRDSYLALIDSGKIGLETVSNRRINQIYESEHGIFDITSSGWMNKAACSIKINDVEYSRNSRGLNFVVMDKETGNVLDSVFFDTWQEYHPAQRDNWQIFYFLREYELNFI